MAIQSQIKLAIAEDHPQLLQSLRMKLEQNSQYVVKYVARNGRELLDMLQEYCGIDLVLMDLQMPLMDGVEATAQVKSKYPHVRVLVITVFDDDHHIFEAIKAGASGYVLKDLPSTELQEAIEAVMEDRHPIPDHLRGRLFSMLREGRPAKLNQEQAPDLTGRELEVLKSLDAGLTYEGIAQNLFISQGTVRKHVENLYRKLEAHNRTEALKKARGMGLFS